MEKRLTAELAYWINERYAIKLRRDEGMPKPWTADRIFQTVRFCNVHREDDKVTKWIREYWNRAEDPIWKFVLGRMINLPESLHAIRDSVRLGELSLAKEGLKNYQRKGNKVFTSAYTISTCGRSMDKLDYVFDHVVSQVAEHEGGITWGEEQPQCQDMFAWLTQFDGLGTFLAAQVVADMKNTAGHPLQHAPDWWTFSAPGPGSLRGLGWWYAQDPNCVREKDYYGVLEMCRADVDSLVMEYVPRIGNQDFQNCLCEFSKYCKRKYLNGHVRNTYNGLR